MSIVDRGLLPSVLDRLLEPAPKPGQPDPKARGQSIRELRASLSVRATDEACIYLKHPLFESEQKRALGEVLKSSFCGRFSGAWDDPSTDAGAVWLVVDKAIVAKEKS